MCLLSCPGTDLHESDSSDMMDVIAHVKSSPEAQKQLQSLLDGVTDLEKRAVLEKAWEDDCTHMAERSQFRKDQDNCRKYLHITITRVYSLLTIIMYILTLC